MNKPNPKHAQPLPLAGQQLPDDWRNKTADYGGTYDRRNFAEIFQQGTTNKKIEIDSPAKNARLQPLSWDDLYGKK